MTERERVLMDRIEELENIALALTDEVHRLRRVREGARFALEQLQQVLP